MKRFCSFFTLAMFLAAGLAVQADDLVRDVQTQLKGQGFYFGEVDGQAGKDFTAAVRRYQIRNGLEVTGELNDQVTQALGIGGGTSANTAPPANPAPTQVAPPATARPPVNLRRQEEAAESDRRALSHEEVRPAPSEAPRPPAGGPGSEPSEIYRDIFAGSPYAIAPRPVQEETLLRAQRFLVGRGLLDRSQMDGLPGRITEQAIAAFQQRSRLPASGHLDLETLSVMRLLPGRPVGGPNVGVAPEQAPRPAGAVPGRVARPLTYRGIWVQ